LCEEGAKEERHIQIVLLRLVAGFDHNRGQVKLKTSDQSFSCGGLVPEPSRGRHSPSDRTASLVTDALLCPNVYKVISR